MLVNDTGFVLCLKENSNVNGDEPQQRLESDDVINYCPEEDLGKA
jgi:hypothetical protein